MRILTQALLDEIEAALMEDIASHSRTAGGSAGYLQTLLIAKVGEPMPAELEDVIAYFDIEVPA